MPSSAEPLFIQMHPGDNVAIVANDGGLAAGTTAASGLTLRERIAQGHKSPMTAALPPAPRPRRA